jgi:hypothetical protein
MGSDLKRPSPKRPQPLNDRHAEREAKIFRRDAYRAGLDPLAVEICSSDHHRGALSAVSAQTFSILGRSISHSTATAYAQSGCRQPGRLYQLQRR